MEIEQQVYDISPCTEDEMYPLTNGIYKQLEKIKIEDINVFSKKYIICGVYFLIKNGFIVYVGQSTNVLARISVHGNNKSFDSFKCIRVPEKLLYKVERYFIRRFMPKLNNDPYISRIRKEILEQSVL